jgi:hypothetical protein
VSGLPGGHDRAERPTGGDRAAPDWELVLKRNSVERLKREKFPLDIIREWPQLARRCNAGAADVLLATGQSWYLGISAPDGAQPRSSGWLYGGALPGAARDHRRLRGSWLRPRRIRNGSTGYMPSDCRK